jgi:hypothetical protein
LGIDALMCTDCWFKIDTSSYFIHDVNTLNKQTQNLKTETIHHHEHCEVRSSRLVPMNLNTVFFSPSSFWSSLQSVTEFQLWKADSLHSFQENSPLFVYFLGYLQLKLIWSHVSKSQLKIVMSTFLGPMLQWACYFSWGGTDGT